MKPYFCPIVQIYVSGRIRVPLPLEMHVVPTFDRDHPLHVGYGPQIIRAWTQFAGAGGMLWIEGDVAIEQLHLDQIAAEHDADPNAVVAVPFRLYPASTLRQDVVWAHSVADHLGTWRLVSADMPCPRNPAAFGLGCTYLPARLLDEARRLADPWEWPYVDSKLSGLALDLGIRRVCTPTPAVHLHY